MIKWNYNKFIVFCIVGLLSAIVDLIIFNQLFNLNIGFKISRASGVIGAVIFTFFLNREITFSAKNKKIINQLSKHLIIYGIVLFSNVLVSSTAVYWLGEEVFFANLASIVGIVYGIPISFIGSMLWTFKK